MSSHYTFELDSFSVTLILASSACILTCTDALAIVRTTLMLLLLMR